MLENALCPTAIKSDNTPVPENRNTSRESQIAILERLEDLESKVDDMELILSGLLPAPRRRSGTLVSWFRTALGTLTNAPGSTIGTG